jgi:nucleotide-binding universal stress UspA family protein
MFKTILIPTDGSSLSDKAAKIAVEFAQVTGASLVVISVAVPYLSIPSAAGSVLPSADIYDEGFQRIHDEQSLRNAQNYVDRVAATATSAGVLFETTTVTSFTPHEEIIKAVDTFSCDAVFMASHGRKGINKFLLGSETQKVLASCLVPVLVIR